MASCDQLFMEIKQDPHKYALLLDFDGTLVDISSHPDAVFVPNGLPELLNALHRYFDSALAIVTGRKVSSIKQFLPGIMAPIVGQHGAESSIDDWPQHPKAPLIKEYWHGTSDAEKLLPGLYIEMKGHSATYHYRANPSIKDELHRFLVERMTPYASYLELRAGKEMFELVLSDVSKAASLGRIQHLADFMGRTFIFAGDDTADADAISTAKKMGGHGIWIGSRPLPDADLIFQNSTEFRAWLGKFLEA